jgi:hypothetical protein
MDDEDYRRALEDGFSGKAKPGDGKSGQLFLMTKDKSLVIKTLKGYEAVFLRKILTRYLEHLTKYPDSLLCRFYDVVTLNEPSTGAKISLLVMPNIMRTGNSDVVVGETFDLKGSVRNRRVSEEEIRLKNGKITLKDLNWNERCCRRRGKGMLVENDVRVKFERQLALDSVLLRELDIMDYSLLVGIAQRVTGETCGSSSSRGGERTGEPKHEPQHTTTSSISSTTNTWSFCEGGIPSTDGSEIYYVR